MSSPPGPTAVPDPKPRRGSHHEYLLAFSCKGRWFCPSCHQKKVQLFGALLTETILFPGEVSGSYFDTRFR